MPQTHQNALDLRASRMKNRGKDAETERGPEGTGGESESGVNEGAWILLFGFAGGAWLIGLAASALIPIATFIVNYIAVGMIWFWAKINNLKPPSFSSLSKAGKIPAGASSKAAQGAGEALEKIEEAVPGNDLLYIAAGGIHPAAYVFALWVNNR